MVNLLDYPGLTSLALWPPDRPCKPLYANILSEGSRWIPRLRLSQALGLDSSDLDLLTYRSSHSTVRNAHGHTGCVNALAWEEGGEGRLASGGDDTKICIWKAGLDRDAQDANGSPSLHYGLSEAIDTGHRANIFSVKWAPFNSNRLFSAAGDTQVRVYDIGNHGSGETVTSRKGTWTHHDQDCVLRVFKCHSGRVKRVATENSPDVFLTCSEDGTVRQHDLRNPHICTPSGENCGRPLLEYPGLSLYSLTISKARPYMFVVADDRRMIRQSMMEEWGVGIKEDQLTQCVRRFGVPKMEGAGLGEITNHVVAAKLNDTNPRDLLVSYSGDAVYLFDTDADPQISPTPAKESTITEKENDDRRDGSFDGNQGSSSQKDCGAVLNDPGTPPSEQLTTSNAEVVKSDHTLSSQKLKRDLKNSVQYQNKKRKSSKGMTELTPPPPPPQSDFNISPRPNPVVDTSSLEHGASENQPVTFDDFGDDDLIHMLEDDDDFEDDEEDDSDLEEEDEFDAEEDFDDFEMGEAGQRRLAQSIGERYASPSRSIAGRSNHQGGFEVGTRIEAGGESTRESRLNPDPRRDQASNPGPQDASSNPDEQHLDLGDEIEVEHSDDWDTPLEDEGDDEEVDEEDDDGDGDNDYWNFSRAGLGIPQQRRPQRYDHEVPMVIPRKKFEGHVNADTVKDVNFAFGAGNVISGSDDGNFFLWDKESEEVVGIFEGDESVVNVMQSHPQLPVLAISGIDSTIKIFAPTSDPSKRANLLEKKAGILEKNRSKKKGLGGRGVFSLSTLSARQVMQLLELRAPVAADQVREGARVVVAEEGEENCCVM